MRIILVRRWWWWPFVLAACSASTQPIQPKTGTAPEPPPLRVELGACAPAAVSFVSGPRPWPFTVDERDGKRVTAEVESVYLGSGCGSGGDPDASASGTSLGKPTGGGGVHRRNEAEPMIAIGRPSVEGNLDREIIRRYVKRNQQKLLYCYEKELAAKPTLSGKVFVDFTIEATGRVTGAKTTGISPEVSSCVQQVIAGIEFPKPTDSGTVAVSYPLLFRSESAPPIEAPAIEAPPLRSPADSSTATPARSYVPGVGNPLRGREAALAACLRKQRRGYGVFVVDLAYEASGARAAVHGLDDEAARACIVEIARTLGKPRGRAPAHRCSVAFGDMPVADALAVEITADELRWLGRRIETPAAIIADTRPELRIDALFEAAAAYESATAASTAAIALRGPIVLRAIDATPMKVVGGVLRTMDAAGVEIVLARRGPSGWKLLRRMGALPVVPVPAGTGASWSRCVVGEGRACVNAGPNTMLSGSLFYESCIGVDMGAHFVERDLPELSILVTPRKIWVVVSRAGERRAHAIVELPARPAGHDLDQLERVLAEHKRSAAFSDRVDLEVAAEDEVPYGDVASILELADKVGFGYAQVVEQRALAVRPPR